MRNDTLGVTPVSTGPARQAERVLRDHGLWGRGLLVAVSGGLDSVCLLRVLAGLAARGAGRIEVAHVDHGLRPGSGDDAAFCRDLARELGCPFHLRALRGAGARGNLQAWARRERRAFLEETLAARRLGAVALGHHGDDQVETVLFRLIRGAGPRGLAGMREHDPPYVRPLLRVRRRELEALAREQGWRWREDPTNRTARFARNRIRRELVPLLRSIHPGAERSILRAAGLLEDDDRALSGLAREALWGLAVPEPEGLRMPAAPVGDLDPALRRRVYLAAWERVGGDPSALECRHLRALDALLAPGAAHREAPIPGPARVVRSYADLWFLRPGAWEAPGVSVRLAGPGVRPVPPPGARLVWGQGEPPGPGVVWVPARRGIGGLTVRTWRPGDRVTPGPGGPRKVKDLLMEARVPRWRRRGALVVGDGAGWFGLLLPGRAWSPARGPTWVLLERPRA